MYIANTQTLHRPGDTLTSALPQGMSGIFKLVKEQLMLLLFCEACRLRNPAPGIFEEGRVAILHPNHSSPDYIANVHQQAFHRGNSKELKII